MHQLKRVHFWHGVLLTMMLATGAALFFSSSRTWFAQMGIPLVPLHLIIAVVYGILVFFQLPRIIKYARKKPRLRVFNVYSNLLLFALWLLSGAIMYIQSEVPPTLRNAAVLVHDGATVLLIPWYAAHAIGHLFNKRLPWPKWWQRHAPLPPAVEEVKWQRRDVLKMIGLSAAFLAVASVFKWTLPVLTAADSSQRRKGYFRIYNVTSDMPDYTEQSWSLRIDGRVSSPVEISMEELRRIAALTIVDDFHCVTGWSVHNVEMKGVRVSDILAHYNMTAEGAYASVYSGDGVYFDTFTQKQLLEQDAMIVFELDGEPLKKAQGFPCRLYHPDMYGYKSVKWVNRIEFTDSRDLGYWQQSGGYDLDGYL